MFLGDNSLFAYTTRIAMGHAINRAWFLDVEAEQLAVWDGETGSGVAGTANDVAIWRRTGRPTHLIALPRQGPLARSSAARSTDTADALCAILFTDLCGFSRLHDEHFATYVANVLAAFGAVLRCARRCDPLSQLVG